MKKHTKTCPECGQPMDYTGADVVRSDTGEHWLCVVVHFWECTHPIFCGNIIEEPVGESWVEEYDRPETWRDHAAIAKSATFAD